MGSRVPSVSIRFARQESGDYRFSIQNSSGHNITAYDVLLVPSGVPKKDNHFVCQGRCSDSQQIGDIDQPVIKAGGTSEVTYEIGQVTGGAVILEAAVFDNGTYAGSERAAAVLIANQLGNQAEFDRIVPTVDTVLATTGPQNVGKATQINSALAGLPVDADSDEMAAFIRWFPNLRDCSSRFPQIMQELSGLEKSNVAAKLQQFLSTAPDPSDAALANWWSSTEQYLAGFGCSGCATKMASPNPPARPRTISVGCSGSVSGGTVLAADDSGADDDSSADGTDQTAANDADAADQGADSNNDELAMTEEPADEEAPVATTSRPAPMTSSGTTSIRHSPTPPRLIPFFGFAGILPRATTSPGRTGIATGTDQQILRPVTDDQLYPRYFRYVVAWEKYLEAGGTPETAARDAQSPDPYSVNMKAEQRSIMSLAAFEYEDAQHQSQRQSHMLPGSSLEMPPATSSVPAQSSLTQPLAGRITTWTQLQQAKERSRYFADRRDEQAKLLDARLQKLRAQLGKTPFRELDDYVHGLYHVVPGRRIHEPLSENAMYSRYLSNIATMDKFAANDSEDCDAAARARVDEQKACGLSDKDEAILQQAAEDFQNDVRALTEHPPGAASTTAAGVMGRPASVSPLSPQVREQRNQIAGSHIEQLRSSLTKASFQKIGKRVHVLYQSDGPEQVIPATELMPKSKEAKISELPPIQH